MEYEIEFKPKAIKDICKFLPNIQSRILENNLQGDIKKLTNFTPEYCLRIGNYRVLFEIEQQIIIIYRIKHRSKAYE